MPKLSPTMEEGQLSRWLRKRATRSRWASRSPRSTPTKPQWKCRHSPMACCARSDPGRRVGATGSDDRRSSASRTKTSRHCWREAPAAAAPAKEEAPAKAAEAEAPAEGTCSRNRQSQSRRRRAEQLRSRRDSYAIMAVRTCAGIRGRLIVSPLAARMAAEAGIDLRSVQGSGPADESSSETSKLRLSQPEGCSLAAATLPTRSVEPGAATGLRLIATNRPARCAGRSRSAW